MSRLLALIDAYKDTHGQPSDSSIARAIGSAPQTISSWRKRGIKSPPDRDLLRRLAGFLGKDYETVVLRAVLIDVGWIEESDGDDAQQRAAAPMKVTPLSERRPKVADDDLAGLPSVAHKKSRSAKGRDED